ncbi:MAG: DUF3575 domain-containing protein [Rikenellaceae bacterium]|nr:DUF3575 domain-containing protein [Rikenellaceae bacterium]MCL2692817.1 DUF3575 domain-containing protein [Rikenellaceae bacterium]
MKKLFILTLLLCCVAGAARAQSVSVKTNLLWGGYTQTPNLGIEFDLGGRKTLDVGIGYNPWNLEASEGESNKKLVHLMGNVELRHWLCRKFSGHFFGVHVLGAQYNIAEYELPLLLGERSRDFRFEGIAVGAGVSWGYQFILGMKWNLEVTVGAGYIHLDYDKFESIPGGGKLGSAKRDYMGPTKAGVTLMYVF